MTTEGHIEALERKHCELEMRIDSEQRNLTADDLYIGALKRKKLEIKDQLARMQAHA